MSRTANDAATSGVFLPNLDVADKAPSKQPVWAPEDDHPWTAEEDKQLRVIVETYRHYPIEDMPWQLVALKANFGHNSGSCKARYLSLPALKWADCSHFHFAPGGGVTAHKRRGV